MKSEQFKGVRYFPNPLYLNVNNLQDSIYMKHRFQEKCHFFLTSTGCDQESHLPMRATYQQGIQTPAAHVLYLTNKDVKVL